MFTGSQGIAGLKLVASSIALLWGIHISHLEAKEFYAELNRLTEEIKALHS